MSLIFSIINIYELILFAAVLASWIDPLRSGKLSRLLAAWTDPVLRPLRSRLPHIGGFDISPIVCIILLEVVKLFLVRIF